MSIPFNARDTDYKGLVQIYEKEAGFNRGDVSGDANMLLEFTAEVNQVLDDFRNLAIRGEGTWESDDTNHADFDIFYTSLVSGQRSYLLSNDANGNAFLDIRKLFILPSATATLYQEIYPIDELNTFNDITAEATATGAPYRYGKLDNAIFLDPPAGYSVSKGLKMYAARESNYFVSTDTSKKPGVPSSFHRYFAIKPARWRAGRLGLANYTDLVDQVLKFEGDPERGITGSIEAYYGRRAKDEKNVVGQTITGFI